MKLILGLICALLVFSPFVNASDQTQTFSTSAGPVMITPLTHASTLIQAGGKDNLSRSRQTRELR